MVFSCFHLILKQPEHSNIIKYDNYYIIPSPAEEKKNAHKKGKTLYQTLKTFSPDTSVLAGWCQRSSDVMSIFQHQNNTEFST